MSPRGTPTRGRAGSIVFLAALVALATTVPVGAAHADVAFRKKKSPAASSSKKGGAEASPSGGEPAPAAATDSADAADPSAEDAEKPAPNVPAVPQAEDRDKPHDPSLIEKTPAELALEKQAAAKKDSGPPVYTKWQFWAIVGGAAVGAAVAIWGGLTLAHEANGGDVRACNPMFTGGCFGQGR